MRASLYILIILVGGIVVPVASILAFNVAVDSFRHRSLDSQAAPMNHLDPGTRSLIPYDVRRVRPRCIVLGSSRCVMGIDTNYYYAWPESPVYNMAVFQAVPEELLAYLRHAQGVEPLDTVVLGLDFFSFNAYKKSRLPNYEHVLSYRDIRLGWQFEWLRMISSASTMMDSIRLLWDREFAASVANRQKQILGMKRGGRISEGVRARFLLSATNSRSLYFGGKDLSIYSFGHPDGRSTLEVHRQILAFCYVNEIDLKLFISPVHAVQMELIDGVGLWPAFELWKRHLVDISEEAARKFDRKPHTLWDFSGYNSITTEDLSPAEGENVFVRHYFDGGHYYPDVGNMVLDTLFDRARTPGFGEQLTAQTIDQVLVDIREDRAQWRQENSIDYKIFRDLAQKIRPKNATIDMRD